MIDGKTTTYNPDYWCPEMKCYIECATSRSIISEQGRKWAESIRTGLKLRIYSWDGIEITELVLVSGAKVDLSSGLRPDFPGGER